MQTQNDKKSITIIDTFGFLFRSFYALPMLKSKDDFPTGLLTGFANFIYSLGKEFDTSYIIFALDSKGASFRKEIFDQYKANRQEAPIELKQQLPIAISWIEKMGFATLSKDKYEADDIIASLAHTAVKNGYEVKIVSHDKDLNQLISTDIRLFDPIKKVDFSKEDCFIKFGVYPEQFIDYQSIVGDSSDNIPGVKGIGTKGASKLIKDFGSLENIYDNIDIITPPRAKKLLLESREICFVSRELVTLKTDLYDSFSFEECVFPKINPILQIQDELLTYGIYNILDKVKKEGLYVKTQEPKKEKKTIDFKSILLDDEDKLFQAISLIEENDIVAFDTETDSLDALNANIIGFSFCFNNANAYYVPISHISTEPTKQINKEIAKRALEILLKKQIIGHNIKFDMHVIAHNFNITNINIYADTIILAWLINPAGEKSLDALSSKYLGHKSITFKSVVPPKGTFANVDIPNACKYASEDAWISLKLYILMMSKLDKDLLNEALNVEYPFIKALFLMESNGIKIDINFFKSFQKMAQTNIESLTKIIHSLAEEEFNINSPKQLSNILFDKLGLKSVKKTKTGKSTNKESLKEIIDAHEIIKHILEYKKIYKLQSTYVEPLIELSKKNSNATIHTNFMQVGTSTGRLSSNNPNLQNISVRTKLGNKIREGFIAQEDCHLIGIDYSQIEFRLLAHFSKDDYLVETFSQDKDIHLQTAIKLFGVDVATSKRDIAKTINFGILYGMGSRRLHKLLNIPVAQAKEYIENYFDSFSNVRETIDGIKEFIEQNGYIETLLKRKRYFNMQNITQFEKSNFLREGVNAVFQGSGADLIKMAMNKITDKYKNNKAKILLQIHDEIIIQTHKDDSQEVADECKKIMENIASLHVPLKTSIYIGKNWGELKG